MSFGRSIAVRYDRRSAIAFALLVTLAASVGYSFSDLVDIQGDMDWLLAGIWVAIAVLIVWNVNPRRDLVLLAAGLAGGTVIEWWGTTTELWRYFTDERPPPWILPAWPCAALAIDRLGVLVDDAIAELERRRRSNVSTRAWRVAYFTVVPAFVVFMISFASRALDEPATLVVSGVMIAVALFTGNAREDVMMFIAGSALGYFLERWGTTRECWTYYTRETPPAVAVLAHGFAAVAFTRVRRVGLGAWDRVARGGQAGSGAALFGHEAQSRKPL